MGKTGFDLWFAENEDRLKKKKKGAKQSDITKAAKAEWDGLTTKERKKYEDKASGETADKKAEGKGKKEKKEKKASKRTRGGEKAWRQQVRDQFYKKEVAKDLRELLSDETKWKGKLKAAKKVQTEANQKLKSLKSKLKDAKQKAQKYGVVVKVTAKKEKTEKKE